MCSSMKRRSWLCSSLVRAEYSKSMVSPAVLVALQRAGRRRSGLLRDLPAHFGKWPCPGRRLPRLLARRRAGLDSLGDSLQDAGDAKQVVGEVEIPVGHDRVGIGAAGTLAVATHVFLLARDAERGVIEPADAAKRSLRDMPRHAVIAEVGERMAERREFPIEHGDDARRARI